MYFAKTIDASIFDDGIKKKSIANISEQNDISITESNL
jgi:hypothetical protein